MPDTCATITPRKVTFRKTQGFHRTLRRRVEEYFEAEGKSRTGDWRMFAKTAFIISGTLSAYLLLVFVVESLAAALVVGFALSQGIALVGFNVMHDGNHGAYSSHPRLNRLMGFTLDLVGGSNMLWRQKHNILHHTYTNITDLDEDIETGGLLRLSPNQPRRWWHRLQHFYAVPLYGMLTLTWFGYADYRRFFTGRISTYRMPRPAIGQVVAFFLTRALYIGYALVLPALFRPLGHVVVAFVLIHLVLGFTLSIVFQLAHTVDENTFPEPDPNSGNIENEWAIHQVETTANFATSNGLVNWYLGGLNHQIEHHLFPRTCHIHYRALSAIVERTCREFDVRYVSYPTIWSALSAHFRFLREMGAPESPVPQTSA